MALGDPGGRKPTAKTGNDEVNGDSGAHKQRKTKREEAEEEKKVPQEHPKGSAPVEPGPPFGGNVGFTTVKLMFLLIPLGRSKMLLGGLGGSFAGARAPPRAPGGPLGWLGAALWEALGGLRATLGGPRDTLRGNFWKTGGIAKGFIT